MELEEEPVEDGAVRCIHGATEVWAPVCICVISVCSHAALPCSDCKLGDPESRASLRQISWHHFKACVTIQGARPPAGPMRMQDPPQPSLLIYRVSVVVKR